VKTSSHRNGGSRRNYTFAWDKLHESWSQTRWIEAKRRLHRAIERWSGDGVPTIWRLIVMLAASSRLRLMRLHLMHMSSVCPVISVGRFPRKKWTPFYSNGFDDKINTGIKFRFQWLLRSTVAQKNSTEHCNILFTENYFSAKHHSVYDYQCHEYFATNSVSTHCIQVCRIYGWVLSTRLWNLTI